MRLNDRHVRLVRELFRLAIFRDPAAAEIRQYAARLGDDLDALGLLDILMGSREYTRRDVPFYVPPGHFYSPIVNPRTVAERPVDIAAVDRGALPDLALDVGRMECLWHELLPFLQSTPFPELPSPGHRYFFLNPSYSYGDASLLRALILHYRPQQIIEIGAGYSSVCMLDTIAESKVNTQLTSIEPHPELLRSLLQPGDEARITLIPAEVQEIPLELFEQLQSGDFLFIDSSHVVKTGSDVVFVLGEILPRIGAGVIVHFHDVFYPFEYPRGWIHENRSWNELYALRAFLAYNGCFEILFFSHLFALAKPGLIEESCPVFAKNAGGSLWLRRQAKPRESWVSRGDSPLA